MDAEQTRALANLGAVVSQPNDWQQRRYEAIARCRQAGLSYQEIGDAIGVSRQAVRQFVIAYGREKGAA